MEHNGQLRVSVMEQAKLDRAKQLAKLLVSQIYKQSDGDLEFMHAFFAAMENELRHPLEIIRELDNRGQR